MIQEGKLIVTCGTAPLNIYKNGYGLFDLGLMLESLMCALRDIVSNQWVEYSKFSAVKSRISRDLLHMFHLVNCQM